MENGMMNYGKKLGLAALLAVGGVASANAGTMALDTFDYNPSIALEVNDSNPTTATVDSNDINSLDGDVRYELDRLSGPLSTKVNSYDNGGDGVMIFSNDGFTLGQLSLTYSAFNGTPSGPIDLTGAGSYTAFYYDVVVSDIGFDVDITIGSNAPSLGAPSADVSTLSQTSTSVGSLTRFVVDFNSFGIAAGAGADFSNVDFVNITFTAFDSVDLVLSEFGVVPEPSTIAIFGLALVGFAFSSKRKFK